MLVPEEIMYVAVGKGLVGSHRMLSRTPDTPDTAAITTDSPCSANLKLGRTSHNKPTQQHWTVSA